MIITGLGNPGQEFAATRHNFGFMVLDALATSLGCEWQEDRSVLWSKVGQHWLLKPQSYMNRSGHALSEFFRWHNISAETAALHANLLVVHDDLDFPLGTLREQRDRSSAGHNGVQSIIDAFSTKDFSRLRLGIAQESLAVIPTEEFVLQQFLPNERPLLDETIQEAVRLLTEKISEK